MAFNPKIIAPQPGIPKEPKQHFTCPCGHKFTHTQSQRSIITLFGMFSSPEEIRCPSCGSSDISKSAMDHVWDIFEKSKNGRTY